MVGSQSCHSLTPFVVGERENQAPGVVKPEIGGNVNFEIKSQFMRELREYTLFGNKNEDAHDHVDRVLNIVSLFNILGVTQDSVLLRVFPFTLTGAAKTWVDRLTLGDVNTWDLLKKAFIQRNISSSSITDGLAAIDLTLTKNALSMRKSKQVEEVNYGEFGCPAPFNGNNGAKFHVGPRGYYTHTNSLPPYGEKKPSLEDLMTKHKA
ncbi:hypothetical protein Tco_1439562 [Tanacetum coccineum]